MTVLGVFLNNYNQIKESPKHFNCMFYDIFMVIVGVNCEKLWNVGAKKFLRRLNWHKLLQNQ